MFEPSHAGAVVLMGSTIGLRPSAATRQLPKPAPQSVGGGAGDRGSRRPLVGVLRAAEAGIGPTAPRALRASCSLQTPRGPVLMHPPPLDVPAPSSRAPQRPEVAL